MPGLPILQNPDAPNTSAKPPWLRIKAPHGERYQELKTMLTERRLHTVCSSAACPNIGECWSQGTATFMILGNECTRACRFCDVKTSASPRPIDLDEPERLAEAALLMKLSHVVITSVARDDVEDGGALHFARCLNAVRRVLPTATLEVLTPDFLGNPTHIQTVLDAKPDVFNHNIETVARLTPKIRSGAQYERSLSVLQTAKRLSPKTQTKTGIMLGLGETNDEVKVAIADARAHNIDILTIGQYLRPSTWNVELSRYATPEEFADLGAYARSLGFAHVESGPLVRSSYHAKNALQAGQAAS